MTIIVFVKLFYSGVDNLTIFWLHLYWEYAGFKIQN